MLCTVYPVCCVQCTLCVVYSVPCVLRSVPVCCVQCTLCVVYSVPCVLDTVYSEPFIFYSCMCSECSEIGAAKDPENVTVEL